jgi:hypothetical protein
MPDPKNITEDTTLAELREQRLLLGVHTLRVYASEGGMTACVDYEKGFFTGTGPTEAAAIEAAFVKLRHELLPDALKQYLSNVH